MRIIGLTGGIACGKSTISQMLAQLGAAIIDGDQLSRALTCDGGAALPAIRASFGDSVFYPDGLLNRHALGQLVFSDDDARMALDALMQPLIRQMILEGIDAARKDGAKCCVLDMPLLYEAGLDVLCDTVWCVSLPRDVQLERLMARDGLTKADAQSRISSQLDPAEKVRRANVVIPTNAAISETAALIPPLYAAELAKEEHDGKQSVSAAPPAV